VGEERDAGGVRHRLLEQLELLAGQGARGRDQHSGHVGLGLPEALHEPEGDRVEVADVVAGQDEWAVPQLVRDVARR